MIVEMAGRPAMHLIESLKTHVDILRQVKDAEVHEIKVSEPREIKIDGKDDVKEGEEMFTAFAECDFEIPSFSRLTETMFDFMPSSVEVVEPDSVKLNLGEATDLLNNISGRMHRYDEIAKVAGERLKQMDAHIKAMQATLVERDEDIAKLAHKNMLYKNKAEASSDKKKESKKKSSKKKESKKDTKKDTKKKK